MTAIFTETIRDSLVLFPFLFAAYLLIELLEQKSSVRTITWIAQSKRFGPLIGSLLGLVPQCGFSAAASEFYTHRIITTGTLLAIYLSTSDEMLPIMLAQQAPAAMILRILLVKFLVGMAAGFLIDLLLPEKAHSHEAGSCAIHKLRKRASAKVFSLKDLLKDAFLHSLEVFVFLFLITLALNVLIGCIGEENLSQIFISRPVIGELLAALVGLIPNCAGSVVITELYLSGVIKSGALIAGLLSAAGIGLLMLFRINKNRRENFRLLGLLYLISVITGICFTLLGIRI